MTLINGDKISGTFIEKYTDTSGTTLKFQSLFGEVSFYEEEVLKQVLEKESYGGQLQGLLLPIVKKQDFSVRVGMKELVMYDVQFAYDNYLLSYAITALPSPLSNVSLGQFQMNLLRNEAVDYTSTVSAGTSVTYSENRSIYHLFSSFSGIGVRSSFTALIHAKIGGTDTPVFVYSKVNPHLSFFYPDGTTGITLSLDTRTEHRPDIHYLFELWNFSVMEPRKTAILSAVRLVSEKIHGDFGVVILPTIGIIPWVGCSFQIY